MFAAHARAWGDLVRHLPPESVLPAAVLLRGRGRVALALGTVALAEIGRRRRRGSRVFPASAALLAPVWLLERGACAWLAVGRRVLFGGVEYAGGRISSAGRPPVRSCPPSP